MVSERRQVSLGDSAQREPAQPRELRPFNELKEMAHDGKVLNTKPCTNIYFNHIEDISYLGESFQMHSMQITNQPELAGEYRAKQVEQLHIMKGTSGTLCGSTNGSGTLYP